MNITWLSSTPNISTATTALIVKPLLLSHPYHQPTSTRAKHYKLAVTCRATNHQKSRSPSNNYYKLLSLSPDVNTSKDEIKRAYRRMALRYHPDVCHEHPSMFVLLNEAYKTLSDPVLRQEYDYEIGILRDCIGSRRSCDDVRNELGAQNWRQQILELKRRSSSRMAQKEGSWASRMKRAHNMSPMEY